MGCKNETEIQDFLSKTRVSIVYTNAMFNASNIGKPVLMTLSDKTYSSLLPQFSKTMNVYLQRQ